MGSRWRMDLFSCSPSLCLIPQLAKMLLQSVLQRFTVRRWKILNISFRWLVYWQSNLHFQSITTIMNEPLPAAVCDDDKRPMEICRKAPSRNASLLCKYNCGLVCGLVQSELSLLQLGTEHDPPRNDNGPDSHPQLQHCAWWIVETRIFTCGLDRHWSWIVLARCYFATCFNYRVSIESVRRVLDGNIPC